MTHTPETELVELLQVEDHFLIRTVGLILVPDFPLPPKGKWRNITEEIHIITPAGEQRRFQANFSITHFNIGDPTVDINRRWRIVVTLPSATKESVPIGSKIYAAKNAKCAITEEGNA